MSHALPSIHPSIHPLTYVLMITTWSKFCRILDMPKSRGFILCGGRSMRYASCNHHSPSIDFPIFSWLSFVESATILCAPIVRIRVFCCSIECLLLVRFKSEWLLAWYSSDAHSPCRVLAVFSFHWPRWICFPFVTESVMKLFRDGFWCNLKKKVRYRYGIYAVYIHTPHGFLTVRHMPS